ncbi:hypothetical protein GALMADRAFT_60407 [Galerina marginata CBS 339.88]|uniref:Uncharacterized protein n=1 Tax=Galerina marginata (strain CBS 339.88) TaxID=685588 RepID=A0A067TF20_GALM3|nr:hypothetical protein GALMADRAFT_60407 [Galerina marginata CBS 339.88]
MLRGARFSCYSRLRGIHTSSTVRSVQGRRIAITFVSTVVAGSALWYSTSKVHNDAILRPPSADKPKTTVVPVEKSKDTNVLYSLVWGSNVNKTLSPDLPDSDNLRTPTVAQWLNGVALRDLQLHQKHAACVDAKGDVYQWGDSFFGEALPRAHHPKLTLRGKNIVELQLTDDKIYALSASGKVYTLAADVLRQELGAGSPTPSSDSWWGTGWLWGEDETVDFVELQPSDDLGRRERFTSIKAGKNHLLALTSKGRVFSHPVNKKANYYGQLGRINISIPDPASPVTIKESHLHVQLIPKSLADPFSNTSRAVRVTTPDVLNNLNDIDDKSIRFCGHLFEIPALRDIEVTEIAAGERTSFIRTSAGKVLGWGANEYGQIGLGSNITLDTITVPTEVILWRLMPKGVQSKCLDITAGGDLTAFTVQRETEDNSPTTIDVLMSGNGQYGGLGNNLYTTAQSDPGRVKAISSLVQYSDRLQRLEPIRPEEISISPTGHVLLALNSSADSGGVGGRDLMVWGRNQDSELGNGKKSSMATPTALQTADGERLMLMNKKAREVRDLHGKVWKKEVQVEQHVAVGYGSSAIYWKIA